MTDFDWENDFRYCTECDEVLVDDDVSYYDMCEECGSEKGEAK